MFFGIDTTEKFSKNCVVSEIGELIKPKNTSFILTGTLRMGTVIRKTYKRSKNLIDWNTYIDQIELKLDGDDVVLTGFSVEFNDARFEEGKPSGFGKKKVMIVIKLKNMREKLIFFTTKKCFPKFIRVLTGKFSFEEDLEKSIVLSGRRTVMTEAGCKGFCEKMGIDVGCFIARR